MPATVQDILDIIEVIAPASLAESWDNTGLIIGSTEASVRKILLGLDPTLSLLEEADAIGANVLITHHPIIFHPLKAVFLEQPDGRFISKAIESRINVIGCHTNLDATLDGVSDVLAVKLGLKQTKPLAAHAEAAKGYGIGRIGDFSSPVSADDFIQKLKTACNPPWLLAAGKKPLEIKRAAICGGSCSELAETALHAGAQVFVTSEVKHSIARWAEQAGLWLIDAGHFATENPAMEQLARQLADQAEKRFAGLPITVTRQQESALDIV